MKPPQSSPEVSPVLTLPWLRLLRWTAVVGQSVTVLVVSGGMKLALPLVPVFACIGFTALTNALLHRVPAGRWETPAAIASCLALDVVQLTVLLHFTGGPHNPFSAFYLAHVALAAVALPARWTALVAGLCCGGYGLLFLGGEHLPQPLDVVCGVGPDLPLPLHLRGMLVAFSLTALAIVFFAGRLQGALRRREVELASVRAAMAQHEHFAALATLAAGAAHELGTPLGTIAVAAGELARVARSLPDQPDLAEDAALIREESLRCRAILDRLQAQAGDTPRPLAVAEMLAKLRERFGQALLECTTADAPETVTAPPEALTQALAVLVKNALEARTDGSPVRLEVRGDTHGVTFAVSDHGPGLNAEARRRAGEPFFTTKPAGQGMGLGLFLVRLLARRLAGEFTLENLPGGGSRATLSFPCQPA